MTGNIKTFDHSRQLKLYAKVHNKIVTDLLSASLSIGEYYATERELAEKFQVSRNTVRKAMGDLEKEDICSENAALGAIVCEKGSIHNQSKSPITAMVTSLPNANGD